MEAAVKHQEQDVQSDEPDCLIAAAAATALFSSRLVLDLMEAVKVVV